MNLLTPVSAFVLFLSVAVTPFAQAKALSSNTANGGDADRRLVGGQRLRAVIAAYSNRDAPTELRQNTDRWITADGRAQEVLTSGRLKLVKSPLLSAADAVPKSQRRQSQILSSLFGGGYGGKGWSVEQYSYRKWLAMGYRNHGLKMCRQKISWRVERRHWRHLIGLDSLFQNG